MRLLQTSTLPVSQRYGEGLSYIRVNGTLQPMANTFGAGSDREWVVVPRVSFNYTSNASPSAPNSTLVPGAYCTGTAINFSNTSVNPAVIENRQFNLNKFIPYWTPFSHTVSIGAADSIYNWSLVGTPSANL